jgi:hypothetical protein
MGAGSGGFLEVVDLEATNGGGSEVIEKGLLGFAAPDSRGAGNCTAPRTPSKPRSELNPEGLAGQLLYWVLIGMPRKCLSLRNSRRIRGFREGPRVARSHGVTAKRLPCDAYPYVAVRTEREEKLLNFLVRPERRQDFL